MSRVTEVQTDTGSYEQFSVNCGQRSEPRYIRKLSDSNQWCDSIVGSFCARQRLKVASQVCSRRYTAAVSNLQAAEAPAMSSAETSTDSSKQLDQQEAQSPAANKVAKVEVPAALPEPATQTSSRPTPTASKAELENELRDIEQKLIDLQAKKLELRAKDLDLMKQQIDPEQ